MTIKEVLDEFAKFIQYDPNQTRFNMLSANYVFHGAGKDIETLLSGYDPSGALSAMRARDAVMEVAQNTNIPLYGWLTIRSRSTRSWRPPTWNSSSNSPGSDSESAASSKISSRMT